MNVSGATVANIDGDGAPAMELEAPRLAQLSNGAGAAAATATAGSLPSPQSPGLSQCVSTSSVTDLYRAASPLTAVLRPSPPPLPLLLPRHGSGVDSLVSSQPHTTGPTEATAGSHSPHFHGAGTSPALLRPIPPRRTNSSLSDALSLQSNLVTSAVSVVHTPRGGRTGSQPQSHDGGQQLATFASLAATPAISDGLENDAHLHGRDPLQNSGSNAPQRTQQAQRDEDGTVIDVSDPGKPAGRSGGRRSRFNGSVGEGNLEFASFGLSASFVSGASSAGGSTGRTYASLYGAVFHIFKGNVGAGVFLLPTYYQDSGYLVGAICVALLGALMVDCTVSLLHVKHRINHFEVKTYPAVVEFVLGDWFQKFTQFALVFTQFGFCIMFMQYASSMLASLFEGKWAYTILVAISTVVVTPMTFISHKLHLLMYASMVAGIFVVVVLAGTNVVDVQHIATEGVAVGVFAVVPTARLIVFLSGHMFSLEGVGIVLPVENSLPPEKRVQFGRVLRYTLVVIVVFYIIFGILGYVAYGAKLHTSVVLALPDSIVKHILQVLLGLSLIFGFPIQYVPAIQIVDRTFNVNIKEDKMKAYSVRVGLNVAFGAVATFIGGDTINIFASFLGAFAGVHLMITIPTLLALQVEHAINGDKDKYTYSQYLLLLVKGPYTLKRCRYYLYLLLALVVWIGGLYFTFESVLG